MKAIDYVAPRSLREAVEVMSQAGDRARILAGGTDLLVQLRERRLDVDVLVDIKHVAEANELAYDSGRGLTLGSAVPCCRIYEHAELARAYPGLMDAVSLVGGIQIQSRATLGGNLCNASPAGDTIPALIAHAAVCVVAGPAGSREVAVERFCTGPGRTVLERGEILTSLRLPAAVPGWGAAYLRFIPRNEMDIAVAGAGVSVRLDASRKRCVAARVALAAVAPTPLLVERAETALVSKELDSRQIEEAADIAQSAAHPISDMRGSADYRRHLVRVLTRRALCRAIDRAQGN